MITKSQSRKPTALDFATSGSMSTLKRALLWMTAIAPVILGGVVIIGWKIESVAITQIRPGFSAMQFNTALCFILSGFSICLMMTQKVKCARITIGLLVSISFLTLLQYISGYDIGLDLLFNDSPLMPHSLFPGRMSPTTALVFTVFSFAILFLNLYPTKTKAILFAEYVSFAIVIVGAISILGYLFGQNMLDSWHSYIQVAVHTSVGFCIIGLALYLQSQSPSYGRLLQSASVILFLLIAPLISDSITVEILFFILGGVLVATFWQLQTILSRLGSAEYLKQSILDSVNDHVIVIDHKGVIVSTNGHWQE